MLSAPGSRNGEGVSQFQVGVPGRCPAPLPLGPECLPLLAVTYARLTLTTHSCKSQKDQGSHLLHRDPWGESARASMPLAHHGGKPCLRKPRQIAWNHRNRLRVQKKAPHQESGCQRDGRGRRHPRRPLVYAERTGLDPAISEDGDLCGGIHRPLSGVVFPTIGAGLLHLNPELGHYLFVALDPESKLIPTFLVGKRDTDTAHRFTQAPWLASTGMAEFS